jgi:hypothetical protein
MNTLFNIRVSKRRGIYSPHERLLASEEGLCTMELVMQVNQSFISFCRPTSLD